MKVESSPINSFDRIRRQPYFQKKVAADYDTMMNRCRYAMEIYSGEPLYVDCFETLSVQPFIKRSFHLTGEHYAKICAELKEQGWKAKRTISGAHLRIERPISLQNRLKRLFK